MIVVKDFDITPEMIEEQKAMLKEFKESPIVYDEDSPELTPEELKQFVRVKNKKRITMYVDTEVIDYYKQLSDKYDIPYQTLINMCLKKSVEDSAHLDFIWNKSA